MYIYMCVCVCAEGGSCTTSPLEFNKSEFLAFLLLDKLPYQIKKVQSAQLFAHTGERIVWFIHFLRVLALCEICKLWSGFELESQCPFATIITITPWATYIYIYIYMCVCVSVCVWTSLIDYMTQSQQRTEISCANNPKAESLTSLKIAVRKLRFLLELARWELRSFLWSQVKRNALV